MNMFQMEVIRDLLLYVEHWMKAKEALMGAAKFKIWVGTKLIKLEDMGLFQDPEAVRCAEVLQLLREEPFFVDQLSAIQQGHTL